MAWIELAFELAANDEEPLTAWLENRGAVALTLLDAADEPIYEPSPDARWQQMRINALFDENETAFAELVHDLGREFSEVRYTGSRLVKDQVWERAWYEYFQPMCFGNRFWIIPSHAELPDDRQATSIRLDPGLAFGTGTHPTTALCLEWLAAHPPRGLQVIDFGCGSGVLAVASACLGARHIQAVDIDPQALEVTCANAEKNHVSDRIELLHANTDVLRPADLILANILAAPLIALAPILTAALNSGGTLLLSGLLLDQVDEVFEAYRGVCTLGTCRNRDGWALIECFR